MASGIALYFRNQMNDAHDKYQQELVNPIAVTAFRDDAESNLWRYRIFAGVSIGLLGYSAYKLFLSPAAGENKVPGNSLLSPEFSRKHVGATIRYAF